MKKFLMPKDIVTRTVGLFLMSFIPGAGVGAIFAKDWVMGGIIAFSSSAVVVIGYLGVVLAWFGKATLHDIQEAFRTATAKAGDSNSEVKKIINDIDTPETPATPTV